MQKPPDITTRDRLVALVPDVVAIVMFGTLARAELVDAKLAMGLMLTVLTARFYRPPPKDGDGGAPPPPAGVAALAVGFLVLLNRLRGASSTHYLETYS